MAGSLQEAFDQIPTLGGGKARARLLVDNVAAWNARWSLLKSAGGSADAMAFILERDAFGFAFLGHLLRLCRAGAKVRLMTDAMADPFGTRGFKAHWGGKDYLQELAAAGAQVGIYHPVWHRPFRVLSLGLMACNHDKTLVVDGRHAITGGRNVSREYFASHRDLPSAWRDTDAAIDGVGPARGLTLAFDREFDRAAVVVRVRPDVHNFVRRDVELVGAYLLMDLLLHEISLGTSDKEQLRNDAAARRQLAEQLVTAAVGRLPAEGVNRAPSDREIHRLRELALQLATFPELAGSGQDSTATETCVCDVKIIDQTAVAGGRVNEFGAALVTLVNGARDSVMIENPYVVLTEEMLATLEAAAARGVAVWIGTNSPLSTDSTVTQAFFLEDWAYILARVPTARVFVATGQARLHAKVATIDDTVTLVTTYNMDFLSGFVNSEVGAVIWSREFATATKQSFEVDMKDPAHGVVEYRIRRDAAGRPLLEGGRPVPEFGPEDHLPPEVVRQYATRRRWWNLLRHLPRFAALRRPHLPGSAAR